MKRFVKWLNVCLTDWIRHHSWEEIVQRTISVVLGIFLTLIFFRSLDTVPATQSDYKQLKEQVNAIQQNPDLLLETDCSIYVNSEIITVEFKNDECTVTAEYDKDFKVLSTSEKDKSMFWLWALIISSVIGVPIAIVVSWPLTGLIVLLRKAVEWACERLKKTQS